MANILNTINVDGTTYNAEEYAEMNKVVKKNDEMGKDAFLQLLVAQMKYQDPLDPQDNSDYLAQLAQFSALEQMTNVSDGLQDVSKLVGNIDTSVLVGQLSSMIGQNISWDSTSRYNDENGNLVVNTTELNGKVTGVRIVDGGTYIVAEDTEGNMHDVEISKVNDLNCPCKYLQESEKSSTRIYLPSSPLLSVNSVAAKKMPQANGQTFGDALREAQQKVTFSKHAMNRLKERNLDLSEDTLAKLDDTVEKMAQKGAKESLIYLDDIAMVVSVANRKVITAMDGESAGDNIFTNIDSAAILK